MKKTLSLCSIAALCTVVNAADPESFSPGGVSVDFSKTFKTEKSVGENLLFEGSFEGKTLGKKPWKQWQKHYYIHAPKHELPDKKLYRQNLTNW